MKIIQEALSNGLKSLSEYQAKKILSFYDIPVVQEELASDVNQAVSIAESIGYPVVLKACSPELIHKTESRAVFLNLNSDTDIYKAYDEISKNVNIKLDGMLVQKMVTGNREIIMGLTCEPQFGKCVMAGLGGIMAEVFNDTSFRIAPFDEIEAKDMLNDLKSKAVFSSFRGQKSADMNSICKCLVALGNIGLKHEEITEIDINPLIIDELGNITAVDATIILKR